MSDFPQQAQESYVTTGLRVVARMRNPLTPENARTIEEQISVLNQQMISAGQQYGWASQQVTNFQNQIDTLQVQKNQILSQNSPVIPPGAVNQNDSLLKKIGRLIEAFNIWVGYQNLNKSEQELLQQTQDLLDGKESARQYFLAKNANDNKGSPDKDASNYDPTATEDNGKSVYPETGLSPMVDLNSPGSPLQPQMGTSSTRGGCGGGGGWSGTAPARFAWGLWQAAQESVKNLLTKFSTLLGLQTGSTTFTNVWNNHNKNFNTSNLANVARFNAWPNENYGDAPLFSLLGRPPDRAEGDVNMSQSTQNDYVTPNPYTPVAGDPNPLVPLAPAVPSRGAAPSVVNYKPSNLLFNNGEQYYNFLPGNIGGGNWFLKVNPYNRTFTTSPSSEPSTYRNNQAISDTIFFDDHDGVNLYINGIRSEDILVKFEHGKAVKFDCTKLSRKNAIAIYKVTTPSIPAMPSFDYDNSFWYQEDYIFDFGDYYRSHVIMFNNNPYTGVYNSSIYMDISSYLRNVNANWTMRYGCVYNHLNPNYPGFKAGPSHDHKAVWFYKCTNNPAISGKIIFIPKDDPSNTFYVTLTTVSANNVEYKKYAISKDEMKSWFIPTNTNKLMLSYSADFGANTIMLSAFTYTFILTNIPPSDALYVGGVSKGFSEFIMDPNLGDIYRKGTVIPNYDSLDSGTYCARPNWMFPYNCFAAAYNAIGTWPISATYTDYGIINWQTAAGAGGPGSNDFQLIKFYHTTFGVHSACSLGVALGKPLSSTGNFPISATAPVPDATYGWTAPMGFCNLRYFNKFKTDLNLNALQATSAVQMAGQFTDQNFCIGYDINSVPLSYREDFSLKIRPAQRVQSSTRWWDSVGTWGANGVGYDFDYERDHDPNSYRKSYPNVKFFVKTATASNELGNYKMIRDFYVGGKVPPIIGRFFVNSNLVGSRIGINFNGGNEPEIVGTVQASAPSMGATTMFFFK